MINIKLLLASDEEIRKLVVAKPWKHNLLSSHICPKCGIDFWNNAVALKTPCTVPDPIPLDFNLAMKMRDECDMKKFAVEFGSVMNTILLPTGGDLHDRMLLGFMITAQPKHYIIAALLVGESADG